MEYTIEQINITQLDNELCEVIAEKIKLTMVDVDGDTAKGSFDFIIGDGEELELHVLGEYTEDLAIIPDTRDVQGSVDIIGRGCIYLNTYAILDGDIVDYKVNELTKLEFERSVEDEVSKM